MRTIWKNYNLSIVLFGLFAIALALQTWMGWHEFRAEQESHGEIAYWLGDGGYVWAWGEATFENWQSEFLQLFTFVVLTAFLVHKGSHESRDTDDRFEAKIDRIERRIARLQAQVSGMAEPPDEEATVQ